MRLPSIRRFTDRAKAAPDDPTNEGEWRRAWRDLWTFADRPWVGDVMYVLAVLAAVAAGYVAQDHKLHPLPSAAWGIGVGIGALVAFRIAIFAVTKHRAPKVQRREVRERLATAELHATSLSDEIAEARNERDQAVGRAAEAEARAIAGGPPHYTINGDVKVDISEQQAQRLALGGISKRPADIDEEPAE